MALGTCGDILLRFHMTHVVASCTDSGFPLVKSSCQSAVVGNISQFPGDVLVLNSARLKLPGQKRELDFFRQIGREQRSRVGELEDLVEALKSPGMTGTAGCQLGLTEMVTAGAVGLFLLPGVTTDAASCRSCSVIGISESDEVPHLGTFVCMAFHACL